DVSVFVMDCTTMGWQPPTRTPPTSTVTVRLRSLISQPGVATIRWEFQRARADRGRGDAPRAPVAAVVRRARRVATRRSPRPGTPAITPIQSSTPGAPSGCAPAAHLPPGDGQSPGAARPLQRT